jgi:hypothetical protein
MITLMARATRMVLVATFATVCLGAAPAQAKRHCVRHGERVVAHSRLLVVVSHDNGFDTGYLACRRATGTRRTLGVAGGFFRTGTYDVKFVRLHGRFAFAVLSSYSYSTGSGAALMRVDTHTWEREQEPLQIGDQNDAFGRRTDVTALVPAQHGRAVLRAGNDFATGIVVAGHNQANYIDEGLTASIGRPHVNGDTVTWRHGPTTKSSPVRIPDRCPKSPPSTTVSSDPTPSVEREDPVFATGDAVTHLSWYCVRATGAVGNVDGTIVRLLGPLAVVQRPADARVVDLRTQSVINGPVFPRGSRAIFRVGRSGTLIYRQTPSDGSDQLIAIAAGQPARTLATGQITDVRYEDGLLRYGIADPTTGLPHSVTEQIP